ncbi:hypothetical protein PsorP6_006383 [Peronosclerospora sorghi]|uniref:Uncharacterized protein n=1 Tax=Peronosclerospora sorghi TaxID=230839 RepID=A0ACC0W661_9STRA|nr:hypothetical protein PsorP6_006383 [Peronosclerospora sorghi]
MNAGNDVTIHFKQHLLLFRLFELVERAKVDVKGRDDVRRGGANVLLEAKMNVSVAFTTGGSVQRIGNENLQRTCSVYRMHLMNRLLAQADMFKLVTKI